ncbi:MAG: quinoprotein glucose dehydrogenase [Arenicella sp.]|jgi:quinoprotein glucose dehydrogenase
MRNFWKKPSDIKGWAVLALGVLFILLGLPMLGGGAWLITLGGSWYYLPAGLALIASGALLTVRRRLGATVYGVFFVVTVLWSLFEVGFNGWALVPRIFGLSILLLLVLAALPVLQPARSVRKFVSAGLGGFSAVVLTLGTLLVNDGYPTLNGVVPIASAKVSAPTEFAVDWPAYGGTFGAQRFSSLTQIDRDNVGQLERAWKYRTGDLPSERWGAETTPLKIGDTVYLCSARNILIALDARTGEERWRHDPKIAYEAIPDTAACRGVAYFNTTGSQACTKRIIEGTLDARLIAVDARTGVPCPDFGDNGYVDTTRGMGKIAPGMVSITSPPTIVRGIVVVGHQILDGERRNAPSGVIQGFDALTGQLRWA